MSLKNLFATGPRIKLRSGDKVLGYALGFNINISTDVQPVYVLGSYSPVSLEPTMVNVVSGTMQIMRLLDKPITKELVTTIGASGSGQDVKQSSVDPLGNPNQTNGKTANSLNNDPFTQTALFEQIDPRTILLSETFDVSVYLKLPTKNAAGFYDEVLWMTVKDCRISSRNTSISMGQLVNSPINFQGLLATPHSNDAGAVPLFDLDSSNKQT